MFTESCEKRDSALCWLFEMTSLDCSEAFPLTRRTAQNVIQLGFTVWNPSRAAVPAELRALLHREGTVTISFLQTIPEKAAIAGAEPAISAAFTEHFVREGEVLHLPARFQLSPAHFRSRLDTDWC